LSAPVEAPPKSVGWAARIAKAPWRLIGIVLLVTVLLNIDLKQVLAQLSLIGMPSVVAASAAFVVLIAGRCWRWRTLTLAVGTEEPLWNLVSSCNRSIWLGLMTPGRIGEFRRAADLSVARGWGLAASSGLVLFDLLIDFGVYLTIGVGGLLYLILPTPWGAITSLAVAACAVAVLLNLGALFGQACARLPVLLRVPGFADMSPALREGLRGGLVMKMLIAIAISTAAHITVVWCLVAPMQLDLSLLEITGGVGLAGVAGAIPITYFGLGTRDVALLWFFSEIGQPATDAIALSLCFIPIQLIGILVSIAMEPLISWMAARSADQKQAG
jgi:glycosyltransferase 2 family protein